MSKKEPVICWSWGAHFVIWTFFTVYTISCYVPLLLNLSASYGSKICINLDNPDVVALRNRIAGEFYLVDCISDRGRRFDSPDPLRTDVSYLASIVPHVAMNKMFRWKVTLDGLADGQGWWFMSCDICTCKSVQDGDSFRCSNNECGGKTAGPS
ncbi:uncharacterized protein LOC112270551 [Brachypodium distachyon]|nr:uncharacterized protein LOC112270551 [Brachypodium distachyon]|eukprot:XP_024313976.1 uncharacterized protein LOC112270551 [Brachypodium distachyon]